MQVAYNLQGKLAQSQCASSAVPDAVLRCAGSAAHLVMQCPGTRTKPFEVDFTGSVLTFTNIDEACRSPCCTAALLSTQS